jgi:type III restriction enzyme
VNYVVADTKRWEQSAAYFIDTDDGVRSFVKNSGLGFAIPYLNNGQMHGFIPEFIIRLEVEREQYLILETKGYDPLKEVKGAAAERWVNAVNAEGGYGHWDFRFAMRPEEVRNLIAEAVRIL